MNIDVFVSPNIYKSLNNSGNLQVLGRDDTKKLRANLFILEIISKWSIFDASIPDGAINSFIDFFFNIETSSSLYSLN